MKILNAVWGFLRGIGGGESTLTGGNMADMVVNSGDLKDWIAENEYEESTPPPQPPDPDELRLIWPTPEPKIITQWYGINPQWYAPFGLPGHEGLDMRSLNGTPIYAMAAGEVIRVETNPSSGPYGIHVRLKHVVGGEEYRTIYAHFQSPSVAVGDKVSAGQTVGLSDNTGNSSGPHLHITVKHIGKGSPWMNTGNIVNPVPYMLDLGRRTMRVVRSNIVAAIAVKLTFAVLVFPGLVTLWMAVAIGDMGVSLGVILNALRLARVK